MSRRQLNLPWWTISSRRTITGEERRITLLWWPRQRKLTTRFAKGFCRMVDLTYPKVIEAPVVRTDGCGVAKE